MVEAEISDMGNGRNLFRKPEPSMSEIHSDDRRNRIFSCQRPFLKKVNWRFYNSNRNWRRVWWKTGERQEYLNLRSLSFWRVLRGKFWLRVEQKRLSEESKKFQKKTGQQFHFPRSASRRSHIFGERRSLRTTWVKFSSSTEHCGTNRSSYWKRSHRHHMNVGYAKKKFHYKPQFVTHQRTHTGERDPLNAISAPKVSCSFQISKFTSESTQVRSHTVVNSAPRSSPMTPPCLLTRRSTQRRSRTNVKTLRKL